MGLLALLPSRWVGVPYKSSEGVGKSVAQMGKTSSLSLYQGRERRPLECVCVWGGVRVGPKAQQASHREWEEG